MRVSNGSNYFVLFCVEPFHVGVGYVHLCADQNALPEKPSQKGEESVSGGYRCSFPEETQGDEVGLPRSMRMSYLLINRRLF